MSRKHLWYKGLIDNVFPIIGAISFFYIAVKLLHFGGLSCLDRRGVALN